MPVLWRNPALALDSGAKRNEVKRSGFGRLEAQGEERAMRDSERLDLIGCQIAFKRDPLSRPIPTPRGVTRMSAR
jgi:hypothetical protein